MKPDPFSQQRRGTCARFSLRRHARCAPSLLQRHATSGQFSRLLSSTPAYSLPQPLCAPERGGLGYRDVAALSPPCGRLCPLRCRAWQRRARRHLRRQGSIRCRGPAGGHRCRYSATGGPALRTALEEPPTRRQIHAPIHARRTPPCPPAHGHLP